MVDNKHPSYVGYGFQAPTRKRIDEAEHALWKARGTLTDGYDLAATVQDAGRNIDGRVHMIAAAVNAQLQAHTTTLAAAKDVLDNAQNVADGVMHIGNTTAADEKGAPTTGSSPAGATSSLPPSSVGKEVLIAGPISAAWADFAAPATTLTGAWPSWQLAEAAPTSKPTTSADLQRIRSELDKAIKQLDADESETKLEEKDRTARGRLKAFPAFEIERPPDALALALTKDTERLYAARRPVLQAVLHFRAAARAVAAFPECADLAALRVMPNDVLHVPAGTQVSYIISQRAVGSPFAVLEGEGGDDAGATLSFAGMQGTTLYRATVTAGAKMQTRALRLVVADSTGKVAYSIPIVAGSASSPRMSPPTEEAPAP